MQFKIFKDKDGLISYLPDVAESNEEITALLEKYRNNEIAAGNEVTIIENNSFISIDGITKTKTYFQVGAK